MFTSYNVFITLVFISPIFLFCAFIPLIKELLKYRKANTEKLLKTSGYPYT